MIDPIYLLGYSCVGVFSGFLAGLLGVGGGLIIVPTLIVLLTWQGFDYSIIAHAAIGTSLATIVTTSIASAWAHHQHQAVVWSVVGRLSLGLFVGALSGAWLAEQLNTEWLSFVFGIFALVVSVQLFFQWSSQRLKSLPTVKGLSLVGFIIGVISGVIGIGGGSMTVPYLIWHKMPIRHAVATSSACGLPIAVAGFMGFMVMGWSDQLMPGESFGYVYWPAAIVISIFSVLLVPMGAKLAHQLPVKRLRRIFAMLLFLIGLKMIN